MEEPELLVADILTFVRKLRETAPTQCGPSHSGPIR
jgi:hypothetical protein